MLVYLMLVFVAFLGGALRVATVDATRKISDARNRQNINESNLGLGKLHLPQNVLDTKSQLVNSIVLRVSMLFSDVLFMARKRKMEKWQGICCTKDKQTTTTRFLFNKLQQHNNKSSVLDRDDTNGLQFICVYAVLSSWFYGLLFWIVLSFIMMFVVFLVVVQHLRCTCYFESGV